MWIHVHRTTFERNSSWGTITLSEGLLTPCFYFFPFHASLSNMARPGRIRVILNFIVTVRISIG